jgi:peptidoglycan hydrolase CwlO-like protein
LLDAEEEINSLEKQVKEISIEREELKTQLQNAKETPKEIENGVVVQQLQSEIKSQKKSLTRTRRLCLLSGASNVLFLLGMLVPAIKKAKKVKNIVKSTSMLF